MLPDSSSTSQSTDNEITGSDTVNTADSLICPQSADSEPDINAYAEAMVRSMESGRLLIQERLTTNVAEGEPRHPENSVTGQGLQPLMLARSSTPIRVDDGEWSHANLDALESAIRNAIASGSQLLELLSTSQLNAKGSITNIPSTDDDIDTSVYEVPAIPCHEPKVRFLTDVSEGEMTTEELSSEGCPSLYGGIPDVSESGTEASDKPDPELQPNNYKSSLLLAELSGRVRAFLKT